MRTVRGGTGGGLADGTGAPPPPVDFDLTVDEGPMRRELMRQIARLEEKLGELATGNHLYAAERSNPHRGPAILTTEQLEHVRDELLAAMARLHGIILTRADLATADLGLGGIAVPSAEPGAQAPGRFAFRPRSSRLLRPLRRLRPRG